MPIVLIWLEAAQPNATVAPPSQPITLWFAPRVVSLPTAHCSPKCAIMLPQNPFSNHSAVNPWSIVQSYSNHYWWCLSRCPCKRILVCCSRCIFWCKGFSPECIEQQLCFHLCSLQKARGHQEKGIRPAYSWYRAWSVHASCILHHWEDGPWSHNLLQTAGG